MGAVMMYCKNESSICNIVKKKQELGVRFS